MIGAALDLIEIKDERLALILKLRYGLVDGKARSYTEIAKHEQVKLSSQRVSMLVQDGKQKIREILRGTGLLDGLLGGLQESALDV